MTIGTSRAFRSALTTTLLAIVTAISLLATTPTAGAANVLTLSPLPHRMLPAFQGVMCASPNTCNEVKYSFAMNRSIENLDYAIRAATAAVTAPDPTTGAVGEVTDGDTVTVFALSGGAIGVSKWLDWNAGEADAPSPEVLSFVVIGNPTRKYGGANRRFDTMPQTQYKVLDIARQYDPVADTPDRFSILARLNLTLGFLSPLHYDYSTIDINDPNNYRWTEGNTTYVLVPTEDLPLLAPLRMLGLSALADRLNGPLKEIIERAYDRPWERDPLPESRTVAQSTTAESATTRVSRPTAQTVTAADAEPQATDAAGAESRPRLSEDRAEASTEAGETVGTDEASTTAVATKTDDGSATATILDEDSPSVVENTEDRQLGVPAARRVEKSDREKSRTTSREKSRAAKRDARSDD
ncbi:hypothetical protein CRI77_19445 [Mycolicibacterium duvalii]|uniref:PE-PPE domain-containing protein n=1 Tax=Mycolicibacterium duvalii TaxID=39688 RepID=A0A7I7JYW4_9MYCO|nr:PE-PPE domain-containing protein [Mycolicibacterium duvalii]MCV7369702.1 PE-PPE domain-containing protein [Mycolicibacterium duvalii]PEG38012.1 hypothetical protein CRI77_19445 [Mycolicibacterium duvalii]BBX16429.1 hypothetical protein MDUV_12890 [Mycolicibacterium duvalii]